MAACEPADSVEGPPMAVVICHCQDCREAHGSPMSTVFLAAADKVTYNSAPTTHLPSCLASTAALRSHDRLTQGAFLLSRWRSRLPGRVRSPWHEQAWLLQRMWHPHELKPLQEWPLRYGHGGHTCGSVASADLLSRWFVAHLINGLPACIPSLCVRSLLSSVCQDGRSTAETGSAHLLQRESGTPVVSWQPPFDTIAPLPEGLPPFLTACRSPSACACVCV